MMPGFRKKVPAFLKSSFYVPPQTGASINFNGGTVISHNLTKLLPIVNPHLGRKCDIGDILMVVKWAPGYLNWICMKTIEFFIGLFLITALITFLITA